MPFTTIIRRIPAWTITILTTIAIALLLLLPHPLPDDVYRIQWFEGADKVVHAVIFGALAAAITIDARLSKRFSRRANARMTALVIIAIIISTCYGAVMEYAQEMLAMGREGSWGDLIADAVGAAAGAILLSFVKIPAPNAD